MTQSRQTGSIVQHVYNSPYTSIKPQLTVTPPPPPKKKWCPITRLPLPESGLRMKPPDQWFLWCKAWWQQNPQASIVILSASWLVGGFNPFETYFSSWMISPSRGRQRKMRPPPSQRVMKRCSITETKHIVFWFPDSQFQ